MKILLRQALNRTFMPDLEIYLRFHVDLASREIVGHGILLVGHIGHPVVGIDVVDAEEVQTVGPQS